MFEADQICPYTGLRSFTEEESLYFKGREDDIDQATAQLQKNKFLMLTGASGDGKSSLIYAGIVPNARAGFLKSKYTQWCVADFRPERTPFQNLCRSIARQLGIANDHTVQSELNHGFSAIIDLYKNSKRYIDVNSVDWQQADDKQKAAMKREAANLIILVDQFEEFFTNPENYHKGVPSRDANLVLNLLLETARISLDEDLPIYIVFTMRSDYIGQCAAFRGLPEYIGFSQFFVPRLNRTQLQQVIEEPAVLSGNRITRRLTERLIHDLTEGVDQLPIVQHALNQIWHAAENGREEMDLIHYAMVGGMPANELPDEQTDRFNKWFETLPEDIKACYREPNLQNVLDTHTNKLYEQAEEYYLQKTGKTMSDEDAKSIIRSAFICLTKIDQSRAVRNRMTLKEITNIIGRPEFGTEEVGAVLNIFREPGNTFIRPFITEDEESKTLKENSVLDITHESLIRNWEYLGDWAKEEFENYVVSLDFEQQLNRWVDSDKSKDFLLSIGQLTYFENWFNTAKPNAHWIARYLPEEIEQDKKLVKATEVLNNSKEFLSRSSAKHAVTRMVMRYGAKRIIAALALVGLIVLGSFAVRDYFQRQNGNVLKSIKQKTFELVNIPKLSPEFPIPVVTEQLILGNVTIPEVIGAIKDPKQKIFIATGIATQLVIQGRNEPRSEILQSLTIADSLLGQLKIEKDNRELSAGLKLLYDLSVTSGLANYFNQGEEIRRIDNRIADRSARWAMQIFKEQPKGFSDMQDLGLALDNGINHKIFTSEEISQLLKLLSPFENENRSQWLQKNYDRDLLLVRGGNNYGPRFNGLYQDLAYLYAANGQTDMVLRCMDTLLQYQAGYYQNDYATHIENASQIAAVYYIYGKQDGLDEFVSGYCSRKKIAVSEFYNRLVSWSTPRAYATNFYAGGGGQEMVNTNIEMMSDNMLAYFFDKLKLEIARAPTEDDRNYNLALALKNEGALFAARNELRGKTGTPTDQFFGDAITSYQKVSKEYLDQAVSVIGQSGTDQITVARSFLFLYPDFRVPFHPYEPRGFPFFYHSVAFVQYLLAHNLFDGLYQQGEDFKSFEKWLLEYQALASLRNIFLIDQMPLALMEQLAAKLEQRNANQFADLNILYLHLSDRLYRNNETDKSIACLKKIQLPKLLNSYQYKNNNYVNNYSFELTANAIAHLTANKQFNLALSFINEFKKEVNRSSLYGYASQQISQDKGSPELARQLLDSALAEMNRLDNPAAAQPNRHEAAIALMYLDPEKNSKEAYKIIKNSNNKFASITRFSRIYAFHGDLYRATRQAPSLISAGDKANFLWSCTYGYNLSQTKKKEWERFEDNQLFFFRVFLPYINEQQ